MNQCHLENRVYDVPSEVIVMIFYYRTIIELIDFL
jgi:hypothetical protein